VVLDWLGHGHLTATGVAIGSHSLSHPAFGRLPAVQAVRELMESRRELEQRLGVEVDSFAIPSSIASVSSLAALEGAFDS
jgi:peptidoglycan/xylan/chitin deacetylase (PgdA/CDA1 family)